MHVYYVYILCSQKNGTLYVGVTGDLARRIYEHKNKIISGFTSKYNVDKLIYAESFKYVRDALVREKQIKKWPRAMKINLIEQANPKWLDLYCHII